MHDKGGTVIRKSSEFGISVDGAQTRLWQEGDCSRTCSQRHPPRTRRERRSRTHFTATSSLHYVTTLHCSQTVWGSDPALLSDRLGNDLTTLQNPCHTSSHPYQTPKKQTLQDSCNVPLGTDKVILSTQKSLSILKCGTTHAR